MIRLLFAFETDLENIFVTAPLDALQRVDSFWPRDLDHRVLR